MYFSFKSYIDDDDDKIECKDVTENHLEELKKTL